MGPPVHVLYIAGSGRSGSTLLSRLLGEVGGMVNVGQAAFHYAGQCPPIPCGCGVAPHQCEFWKDIPANPQLQELGQEFFRKRHFARLAFADYMGNPKARELMFALRELYQSLRRKTGAEVIVDCSKNPARAYMLARTPGVRLLVVHLIRSPYGVAASWREPKEYLFHVPAWRAALSWNFIQASSELMFRRRPVHHWVIRYEDLVESPGVFVEAIATAVLGRPVDCSFLQGNRAKLKVQHMLAGNPDVFQGSDLLIERREPALSVGARLVVSAITFPIALRYGYACPGASWLASTRFPFASPAPQPAADCRSCEPQAGFLRLQD
jgi:hypothetical protein